MSAQPRFARAVDELLDRTLDDRAASVRRISADLVPLVELARGFLTGGKRVRAAFVHWGWHAVVASREGATHTAGTEADPEWGVAVEAAAAVELFHAAALVHDDIIDSSDARRGAPSMHRALETMHRDASWAGRADAWGTHAAIVLGDLLLNWADDRIHAAVAPLERARADAARAVYATMREEVTLGQYLDVLEEAAWLRQEPESLLTRAHAVAVYKSAKYSVEAPLMLGATIAGAGPAQLEALSGYGVPVGTAFQMRDDLLGVFGDPAVTGKPAGDDLREGKRTVLIELARQRLAPNVRVMLDELLGDRDLDARQVAMLQDAIERAGAVDRLEGMIDRAVGHALEALRDATLSRAAVLELERLASAVTTRDR